MHLKTLVRLGASAAFLAGGYRLWQKAQPQITQQPDLGIEWSQGLLTRAAPLLRLPTAPDQLPDVLADGSGLRCPATGRIYPFHEGVLDLLPDEIVLTETQHVLNTPTTAWIYDRFRDMLMRLFGLPEFAVEVTAIQRALRVEPGDVLLDLACGHGNFTVEWAKRIGSAGLVIGLDISSAMLARAATRVNRWGLENVLLIRGDALRLPLADRGITKVNCSGGFHQLPDLNQALREIARVSAPGATLTASTFAAGPNDQRAALKDWFRRHFALHFVPLAELDEPLAALGYSEYRWSLPGGWFGYLAAQRSQA